MKDWTTLITRLARHLVERYGAEEVREWYFEVWNEPNLDTFWSGTRSQYFELYHSTACALKNVDSDLRVGGPATAKNAWLPEFLDFCESAVTPVDFVSTHHYPTDAFGKPGDDTVTQLAKAHRGVLQQQVQQANHEARGIPLFYTEWNSSSNPRDPLHDQPFAAVFVTKTILDNSGMVDCYSLWTFTDIFEENYMPSQPFQGGFGLLTLHDIAKPSYRAFELLHNLGQHRLEVHGKHATVDAYAARDMHGITVILTNQALPCHEIQGESVKLRLAEAPQVQSVLVERIDEDDANPFRLWQDMGKPEYLNE